MYVYLKSLFFSLSVYISDLPRLDQTTVGGIRSCIAICPHGPPIPHSLPPAQLSSTLPLWKLHSDTPSLPRGPSLPKRTRRLIREQKKTLRFISFIVSLVITQSNSPFSIRARQPGPTLSSWLRIYNRKCFRAFPDRTAKPTNGSSHACGDAGFDSLCKFQHDPRNFNAVIRPLPLHTPAAIHHDIVCDT